LRRSRFFSLECSLIGEIKPVYKINGDGADSRPRRGSARTMNESEGGRDDDLNTRLHAMETKLSRMRDQRNQHNEQAKRAAEQRNSLQNQRKEMQKSIDKRMAAQKELRETARGKKAVRDAIQEQLKSLFDRQNSSRGNHGKAKSIVVQLSETVGEMDRLEERYETSGSMTLEAEKVIMKRLRELANIRDELAPMVQEEIKITIDLDDIDGSIQRLKSEADEAHQGMVALHEEADAIWEDLKSSLEDRDNLTAEADRMHETFVSSRESADAVHASIVELIEEVNGIRDQLNQSRLDSKKLIDDHNEAVRSMLSTPDEDEGLVASLSEQLLNEGDIMLGGGVSQKEQRGGGAHRKRGSSGRKSRVIRGGPRRSA
jgi:uncharacterized coiled-coil DUF342 family protein